VPHGTGPFLKEPLAAMTSRPHVLSVPFRQLLLGLCVAVCALGASLSGVLPGEAAGKQPARSTASDLTSPQRTTSTASTAPTEPTEPLASVSTAAPASAAPLTVAAAPLAGTDGRLGAVEAFRAADTTLAYDAGVRWERLTFWWRGLQSGPGQPLNPFYLPYGYIDQERARGVDVVGLLVNTPEWAAQDPSRGGTSVPRNLYLPYDHPDNHWGQFVRRVVEMYRGRIDTWIIWNEPDITPDSPNAAYYIWSGTEADYYQLLKVAYLAAKDANPNARVSTAATTYWTDIHMQRGQWFERFLDVAAGDPSGPAHNRYFDLVALNLYTSSESLYTVPTLYRQLLRERGMDKPLWITETNVIPWDDPVNAGTPLGTPAQRRATLEEQANFLVQGIAAGLAAGVERIEVYRMKDGDGDVVNGEALLRQDYSRRPAYDAFRVAAQYFASYDAARLFAPGDLRQVVFDSGTRRVSVLWNASPTPISVQVPVSGDGQALRVAPSGESYPIAAEGGVFTLTLPGATMHTDLDDPSVYQVGGTPVILVEAAPATPVQVAANLSPATLAAFRPVAPRAAGQLGTGSMDD
jgi:hypothetical protein